MIMAPSILPPDVIGQENATSGLCKSKAGKRHEEYQYLDLIRDILEHGEFRPDRRVVNDYKYPQLTSR